MIMETQMAMAATGTALTQILVKPRTLELFQRVAKHRGFKSLPDLMMSTAIYLAQQDGLLDGQLVQKEGPAVAAAGPKR